MTFLAPCAMIGSRCHGCSRDRSTARASASTSTRFSSRPCSVATSSSWTISARIAAAPSAGLRGGRHQLFFLPKYSPDLNPIEMLFSKLKHALRKAARRAQDAKYHALRLPTAYGPAQRVCQLLRQSRIRSNLESSRSAWSDPLASCGNELRKRWPQTLAQGLLTGLLNSENKAGVDRSASRSTPEAPCWRPTMWAASCGAVAARSKPHP